MKTFNEFIENKRVIIIGPAAYLKEAPISEKIKNYDTVIRVNSSIDLTEKMPHIVGDRTDIVHSTTAIDPKTNTNHRKIDFWIKKQVKHLRISPPAIRPDWANNINVFKKINNNRLEFSVVEGQRYINFMNQCDNTVPNTGFVALLDCLDFNPTKIHLSGITFFKGGYMSEYGISTTTEQQVRDLFSRVINHDIDKQIIYFKKIYQKYNISCDKYIEELLDL